MLVHKDLTAQTLHEAQHPFCRLRIGPKPPGCYRCCVPGFRGSEAGLQFSYFHVMLEMILFILIIKVPFMFSFFLPDGDYVFVLHTMNFIMCCSDPHVPNKRKDVFTLWVRLSTLTANKETRFPSELCCLKQKKSQYLGVACHSECLGRLGYGGSCCCVGAIRT